MTPQRAFVLRCLPWTGANGSARWRFSLQEAAPDAERRAFSSLDDVVRYIALQLREPDRERSRDRG